MKLPSVKLKLDDPQLFGNDAAEDETPEILAGYFLDNISLNSFFDANVKLQLVRARKGMGKSAALAKLAYDLEQKRPEQSKPPLIIKMIGADLIAYGQFDSTDWSYLQNQWKFVILRAIATEFANRQNLSPSQEYFRFGIEDLVLLKGRPLSTSLSLRLKRSVERAGLAGASPAQQYEFGDIWFILDDIDATFADTEQYRTRVATFFSACRQLARELEGLRIRASVRTDVWTALRHNEDLDKCEQYIATLKWKKDELARMLAKRILAYLERERPEYLPNVALLASDPRFTPDEIIELGFFSRLRWGDSMVRPAQPLTILSAARPRWLAQLCRLAGQEAVRRNQTRIGMGEIHAIMADFGRLRLADLFKEHSHQFSDIQQIVEVFSRAERRYSYQDLEMRVVDKYIFPKGAGNIPSVDGKPYRSAKQIIRFLFKINFLMARVENPEGTGGGPTFMNYDEIPEFLSEEERNMPPYLLEVHPSYRVAIGIK